MTAGCMICAASARYVRMFWTVAAAETPTTARITAPTADGGSLRRNIHPAKRKSASINQALGNSHSSQDCIGSSAATYRAIRIADQVRRLSSNRSTIGTSKRTKVYDASLGEST